MKFSSRIEKSQLSPIRKFYPYQVACNKKGIKIYRTQPPFDHSKIMLVDRAWLFVGSANWDVRSFKLNFECNLECMDKELAQQVGQIIAHKKARAHSERLEDHLHPTLWRTLKDNTLRLLTPYY